MTHFIKTYIVNTGRKPLLCLMGVMTFLSGCDDFVDVGLPKDQLTAEAVFNNTATATAALMNIYFEMRGNLVGPTNLGFYTDELDPSTVSNDYYNHTISALSSPWWGKGYNLIYEANALIEGVENATAIPLEDQNQLLGETLFIRGYLHFTLVELIGAIPYITTTDYVTNTTVSRMPVTLVYNHIISDLTRASSLLNEDVSGERIRAYGAVVDALLARVYLYTEDWEAAKISASEVISEFVLEPDLDKVFLKNASGSIWQFKPEQEGKNTREAFGFIFINNPGTYPILSPALLNTFEFYNLGNRDRREDKWVKSVSDGTDTWYHAYKYKALGITTELDASGNAVLTTKEYSVILRLAEQYLIRAEARARLGDIVGAQSDINVIRNRAGLQNTTANTMEDLLEVILHERQVEFFTEQGHRWFDLKRMGKAAAVLAPIKPNWRDTDILFPIPESELLLNPNLLPQNDGY